MPLGGERHCESKVSSPSNWQRNVLDRPGLEQQTGARFKVLRAQNTKQPFESGPKNFVPQPD